LSSYASAKSFAKINLFLRVLSRRSDGYHNIYTLFSAIDLHDIIKIEEAPETVLECNDKTIPVGGDNLIIKADRLLRECVPPFPDYRITLEKNIPAGAGLGGGSSNACAYLKLVNRLNSLGLDNARLAEILGTVGSDAPFFIKLGAQIGEGRGELLKEASLEELNLLVIYPNFPISTKEIYSSEKLVLTDSSNILNMHIQLGAAEISEIMFNSLESAVLPFYPKIGELKAALLDVGAFSAILSGSGSSVFGVFRDEKSAFSALRKIKERFASYRIWKVKTPVYDGG
jgi:4-diphosphocytidyl-2-C-methyl-D-erythritol kinase